MKDRILLNRNFQIIFQLKVWIQEWLIPTLLRRRIFWAAFMASLLAVFYWGMIASDKYVSEAHIIIQETNLSGGSGVDFGMLLGGGGGGRTDQLLLRDYLYSVDMLKMLDSKLDLRAHYSDWHRDPISRMWFKDTPFEKFYSHHLSQVSVEYDDYAGVLIIKSEAYDPATAHAITKMMLEEGERHMNDMAHHLAQDQVAFLEKDVQEVNVRVIQARKALLDFQNKKGMVSPQGTAENIAAIINRLEEQLSELQTRRIALLGYLMPNSPNIVEINQQMDAVEKQIKVEQAKLISPREKVLNSTVEEYQRLQANADFTQEVYKTALAALEKGRVESARTLKKITLLQAPTKPEYPLEPRRIYNSVVFILITLMLAGIVHLLAAIIRDHKD